MSSERQNVDLSGVLASNNQNVPPRAMKGPNGLVELRQFNAVQGWHSGYLVPAHARKLAAALLQLADDLEGKPT